MILVRVAATLLLLATGWMLRRRPILGPLVLLLVGVGLARLWRGTGGADSLDASRPGLGTCAGHHAAARHSYRALTRHLARSRH